MEPSAPVSPVPFLCSSPGRGDWPAIISQTSPSLTQRQPLGKGRLESAFMVSGPGPGARLGETPGRTAGPRAPFSGRLPCPDTGNSPQSP